MPETTLHPPGQRKADTVVAEPLDRYTALRRVGYWQALDFIVLWLLGLILFTGIAWKVFGTPSPWQLLACALAMIGLLQAWMIILIFRCASFVLDLHIIINMMPENAARLVMAAYSGGMQRR